MGESACLMQPFSYAAPQGDSLLGALGQSVSLGRFLSEKLDWEKWSAFSTQNPYVAEAERYSKPGSVAQKKAFFEAHYKNLAAARKAAAAAAAQEAALLLQHRNSKPQPEADLVSLPDLEVEKPFESHINGKNSTIIPQQMEKTPQLLKKKSKDTKPKSSSKPRVSSSKFNSSDNTPSRNKSNSYTFTPVKEFNRLVSIIKKIDGSRSSSGPTTKECKTPLCTPSSNKVGNNTGDSLSTPLSSNKSKRRVLYSSAKTGRGRWNFLPAETPSCFTPFGSRTERREKARRASITNLAFWFEEKFKGTERRKQKQEHTSVGKEESKIGKRLCFKANPLPNFYKQRESK
ncbi:unnamed protein product [Cochlearia groenlandica]